MTLKKLMEHVSYDATVKIIDRDFCSDRILFWGSPELFFVSRNRKKQGNYRVMSICADASCQELTVIVKPYHRMPLRLSRFAHTAFHKIFHKTTP